MRRIGSFAWNGSVSCLGRRSIGSRSHRLLSGSLIAAALVLSGPASGWAASILNEDSKAHVVMVTEGRFRNEMRLAPGEAATEVCAKCQFDIQNVGKMDAQDNDLVVITAEGRLEKRS